MIILCYGMPRSASTFTWQVTYDLINYDNKQHVLKERLPKELKPNFLYEAGKHIGTFVELIPDESFYVVKTHGDYDPEIGEWAKEGKVKTICNIRDPYDLCVSWMDVHEKEIASDQGRPGFEETDSLDKVVDVVMRDMAIAEKWLGTHDPLVFRYKDILGDHAALIHRIVDHIGLETYLFDKVYNFYKDKENITEFNKGVKGRGKAIRDRLPESARKLFDAFNAKYLG